MRDDRLAELTRLLEGRRVSVALADGSRIDDCELVSGQGAHGLWLYSNGADTFVALGHVTDLWEASPPGRAV